MCYAGFHLSASEKLSEPMRLSKVGYYADFVAYPAIILVLTTAELRPAEALAQLQWLIACVVGIAGWTLVEYIIHRFVFHRIPLAARLHDMHHSSPGALIGAPPCTRL